MGNEADFRGSSAKLREVLWTFVGGLSGNAGPYGRYVQGVKLRVGMVALGLIQEDFIAKAAGGTGEDGIQWRALKKATIANRPVGERDIPGLKAQGIRKGKHGYSARAQGAGDLDAKGRLKRGFLTAAEDQRWRRLYAQNLTQLMVRGLGESEARARAGQIAWSVLKSEGAKTKLDVLGNRHVQIGRSSGRLFNSLSPGTADPSHYPLLQEPPPVEKRILREEPGAVVVGSNVDYAGPFHRQRPLWPDDQLPSPWAERIADDAGSGVLEAVEALLVEAA